MMQNPSTIQGYGDENYNVDLHLSSAAFGAS